MRYLFLLIPMFLFVSCNPQKLTSDYDQENELYTISTTPQIIIKSTNIINFSSRYLPFIKKVLSEFNNIAREDDASIVVDLRDQNWSYYDLYYLLGAQYFQDYQNSALVMGMLQNIWIKMALNNEKLNLGLQKSYSMINNIIFIKEFNTLFEEYDSDNSVYSELYKYINSYLLFEILFVSVQELMESPYKYFQGSFYKSIFSHVIILPEMTEYYSYLIKRYGKRRVLRLMSEEYSKENWAGILREEVNDTEKEFTATIENYKFTGLYTDKEFITKLNQLLKLYNTTTKATLFRK